MKKYKTLILISVLIAMALLYYYYLSSKDKTVENRSSDTKVDEISKLINKDLDNSYPATPREVVEFYSRILACYYSGECDEKEIEQLAAQSVKLFDDELNSKNQYETYVENLKADINQYREEKKKISTYIIEKSGDIDYKTFQSHFYAKVDCAYYIKGDGVTSRTLETYTLRKDNTGKWKILYWSLTPSEEDE